MDRPYGKWTRLYVDDRVELRLLELDAGGYCSIHYHESKSDVFTVVSGRLDVRFFTEIPDKGLRLTETIELIPGIRTLRISCYHLHQFWARTNAVAYELSVADEGRTLDLKDIHRLTEAGTGEPKP